MEARGTGVLITVKIYFKTKTVLRERRFLQVMKGSVQQEDVALANICEPNKAAPKYLKQILTNLKGENTQRFNKSKRL